MPAGLQDHGAERERPHVVAAAGGTEGQARVVGVLLGPVEGGVQPGAEGGVLQRVAGELSVGAVQDERRDQQHAGGDESAAGAGGGAAGRYQRGEQGGRGDLVGGQAAAGAPAGDVARVRADEEGGEEAVAGLDGRLQPDRLVVHGGHGLPCLVARLRVDGDGGDETAQLGAVHLGAVGVQGGGDPVGQAGDHGGGAAEPGGRAPAGGGLPGHRPGQRLPAGPLRGDGAGYGGDREAGVGQTQPQGVQVADESGVDDGDPLVAGHPGDQGLGGGGVGGRAHGEAQGPQIVLDRRSGDRLTGEDGGRQPNSLPVTTPARRSCTWWGAACRGRPAACRQRLSDAGKPTFTARSRAGRPSCRSLRRDHHGRSECRATNYGPHRAFPAYGCLDRAPVTAAGRPIARPVCAGGRATDHPSCLRTAARPIVRTHPRTAGGRTPRTALGRTPRTRSARCGQDRPHAPDLRFVCAGQGT